MGGENKNHMMRDSGTGKGAFLHLWICVNNPNETGTAFGERNKNIPTRSIFTTEQRKREGGRERKREGERKAIGERDKDRAREKETVSKRERERESKRERE